MANEWEGIPLGELITLQRGFDLPSQDRKPGKVPIVSSSGISDYHSEVGVKGPGVVTGRYGTIGQVFLIKEDYWPLNTTLWVKDFHGNDPQFASYLLRTVDFRSCSDKSSVPGVNRNDLHQIPVLRPPLAEQKGISAMLGALDDKIELNRRMNATAASPPASTPPLPPCSPSIWKTHPSERNPLAGKSLHWTTCWRFWKPADVRRAESAESRVASRASEPKVL